MTARLQKIPASFRYNDTITKHFRKPLLKPSKNSEKPTKILIKPSKNSKDTKKLKKSTKNPLKSLKKPARFH
jgi:hypothetical protein